jgi:hypothetical protein
MRIKFVWVASIALSAALLTVASGSTATDDAINNALNAIADKLEKGDTDGAKKAAKEMADKTDVEDFMHGFKLRKQGGVGVGKKDTITPDGIELKINSIARDGMTAAAMKKEADALARAGNVAAAIGMVALAKAPEKDDGKKKKSDWNEWANSMVQSSGEFAKAAKAEDAASLRKVATKLKQSCDSCHMVFK